MADVRCVPGQDDVASELARGEPEGKVGNFVELEFCMNPAQKKKIRTVQCNLIKACIQPDYYSVYALHHCCLDLFSTLKGVKGFLR